MGNNGQKILSEAFDEPDELKHFEKLFNLYDKDHNKHLDKEEFKKFKTEFVKYLQKFKGTYGAKKEATEDEIKELSKENIKKSQRLVELSEQVSDVNPDLSVLSTNSMEKHLELTELQEDLDNSVEKLTKFQEGTYDFVADLEAITFEDIDIDGSGSIEFSEFSSVLSKKIEDVKFK
eukprot:gene9002-1101_t